MELAEQIIAIGPEVAASAGRKYRDKMQIIYKGMIMATRGQS